MDLAIVYDLLREVDKLPFNEKVKIINTLRGMIHRISPFKTEPVDFVQWIPVETVKANDYNPNEVAPPEMELLRRSIEHDGYTQPVVTWTGDTEREVVDGFHRTRVCRELADVRNRVHGFLPVVTVKDDCSGRNDRIASTIRHNRARGKHRVDSMSDIVLELKKRNWSDEKIGKELGMDPDEILRLCQISGLSDVFADHSFSKAWDIGDESLFEGFSEEEIDPVGKQEEGRIYHTYDKWECHKYNFYGTTPPDGMTAEDAEKKYYELLSDTKLFSRICGKIVVEWKNSCEHYLTNPNMNRIAWMGQAALAYAHRIPACYRGGYNQLSKRQQRDADIVALRFINKWMLQTGRKKISLEEGGSKLDVELY